MRWPIGGRSPELRAEEVDLQEYDYVVIGGTFNIANIACLFVACFTFD